MGHSIATVSAPQSRRWHDSGNVCMPGTSPARNACCSPSQYSTLMRSACAARNARRSVRISRSEEHTSELQSRLHLVCRLLLEKKKNKYILTSVILLQRILVAIHLDSVVRLN